MTPAEFTQSLDTLGWKQSDFCRKADLDKNTPSRWVNGKTPIPGWVPNYLGLLLELKRLHTAYLMPPKDAKTVRPFDAPPQQADVFSVAGPVVPGMPKKPEKGG